jgi:copper resistance protein C
MQGGRCSAVSMRIIISIIALLSAAGPVFAHAHLDRASPTVGSTVTPAPKEVVLWFTNQLERTFSSIEVRDGKGASVQAGKAVVDRSNRTRMSVPLKALSPGTYKVMWRVLSVDTHRTQGDFTFRVGP